MFGHLFALGGLLLLGACATSAPTVLAPEGLRDVFAAARDKRMDLAQRFATSGQDGVGHVEAVIVNRDARLWLGFRTAGREIALTPAIVPPSKAACVTLPNDGGWWFFEASRPAALRLEGAAELYRYEVERACWVIAPLEADAGKALGGARDSWDLAADDATLVLETHRLRLGPPGLPLGEVMLETGESGLVLTFRQGPAAVPLATIDATSMDGFFGDFISVDRGHIEASSFASARGIRHDIEVAVAIETTAQGTPWFKATLNASFFVPAGGGETLALAHWQYDFGFAGDGVHSHNVMRGASGARPLPFARLVGELDVRELDTPSSEPPFEVEGPVPVVDEEEAAAEPEAPAVAPSAITWYLEAPDGGRIDLWPTTD